MKANPFKPQSTSRLLACFGAACLALSLGSAFAAVDTNGLFELDGNAVDNSPLVDPYPTLPDDWQTLYSDTGHASTTTDPKPTGNVVVEDPAPGTIFTQGGSKDEQLISSWKHKSGSVPDKDDITNAYAANYIDPVTKHQIIYFGADRLSNDGDALMGFWFFQNPVAPVTSGPLAGTFSGSHMDEDVFIIASFTGGGQVVIEQVLQWDHTCLKGVKNPGAGDCGGTNLRVLIPEGSAKCDADGSGTGLDSCAIANEATQTSPWPYTPKSGDTGVFPVASFFEGGIDINALFGETKCFASFLAETRSSSSVDAVLKDFVLGEFNVCKVDAAKTCVNDLTTDDTPTAITYDIRGCAINDGVADIKVSSLQNSIGGAAKYTPSPLAWYVPGQVLVGTPGVRDFNPATDCEDGALLKEAITNGSAADPSADVVAPGGALLYYFGETTATNGPSDEVTIKAVGADGTAIAQPGTDTATCPTRTFNANLSITKSCAADLEDAGDNVVVKIDATGSICNTGEVALTSLSVTDTPAFASITKSNGAPMPTSLASGVCVDYKAYYYPNSIPNGDICPFLDSVTATANAPVNSGFGEGTNCTLVGTTIQCTAPADSATCELRVGNSDDNCATGLPHE